MVRPMTLAVLSHWMTSLDGHGCSMVMSPLHQRRRGNSLMNQSTMSLPSMFCPSRAGTRVDALAADSCSAEGAASVASFEGASEPDCSDSNGADSGARGADVQVEATLRFGTCRLTFSVVERGSGPLN